MFMRATLGFEQETMREGMTHDPTSIQIMANGKYSWKQTLRCRVLRI